MEIGHAVFPVPKIKMFPSLEKGEQAMDINANPSRLLAWALM